MGDRFFTQTRCDRCHGSLEGGRTMSMYNERCICQKCKDAETKRDDYKAARDAEAEQVKSGNLNFKGIGLDLIREANMAKAVFRRKAMDIDELKAPTDLIRGGYQFVIEKVVELDQTEYDEFAANLLDHHGFIEENLEHMFVDSNDVWHAILVKAKGASDGILVESEGYTYARYAAYLPHIDT
jgi:hypothetical protein